VETNEARVRTRENARAPGCLMRIVPLGERHLCTVIREFVEHYHSERNHQGLGNVIPFPSAVTPSCGGIRRRERLGGLLNFYERKAA
jgi:putative transposase